MNHRFSAFALTLLGTATLAGSASAQTPFTEWNFNNYTASPTTAGATLDVQTSPASTTGNGTATSLGFTNTYNVNVGTNGQPASTDTSDIVGGTPASADPGTSGTNNFWRVRGGNGTQSNGPAPTNGSTPTSNGWSSNAPIGAQGAQFLTSTAGFNNIQISFDWNPTTQGEGKLQVQYTLDGSTYINLGIGAFTNLGGTTAMTNLTSTNTVNGGYLVAPSSTNFLNGITASLSSIAAAGNNPNFGIRLVNAATGADDVSAGNGGTTAPGALNNTSGNWRFDEVTISGTAVPEPGTCALVGLCLAGLGLLARRPRQPAA